jgi:hypothetical protein
VMNVEIVRGKLPIQAGKWTALVAFLVAWLTLPLHSQLSSDVALDNTPSSNGQQTSTSNSQTQTKEAAPARRALPSPFDGIFPSSEYLGPTPLIGVPDTDPIWPLTQALWDAFPRMKKQRIKVYGWINPGISF